MRQPEHDSRLREESPASQGPARGGPRARRRALEPGRRCRGAEHRLRRRGRPPGRGPVRGAASLAVMHLRGRWAGGEPRRSGWSRNWRRYGRRAAADDHSPLRSGHPRRTGQRAARRNPPSSPGRIGCSPRVRAAGAPAQNALRCNPRGRGHKSETQLMPEYALSISPTPVRRRRGGDRLAWTVRAHRKERLARARGPGRGM